MCVCVGFCNYQFDCFCFLIFKISFWKCEFFFVVEWIKIENYRYCYYLGRAKNWQRSIIIDTFWLSIDRSIDNRFPRFLSNGEQQHLKTLFMFFVFGQPVHHHHNEWIELERKKGSKFTNYQRFLTLPHKLIYRQRRQLNFFKVHFWNFLPTTKKNLENSIPITILFYQWFSLNKKNHKRQLWWW